MCSMQDVLGECFTHGYQMAWQLAAAFHAHCAEVPCWPARQRSFPTGSGLLPQPWMQCCWTRRHQIPLKVRVVTSLQFVCAVALATQQMTSAALAQARRAEFSSGVLLLRQWTQAAKSLRYLCVVLQQLSLRLWVLVVRAEAREKTPDFSMFEIERVIVHRPFFVHCFFSDLYRLELQGGYRAQSV